MMKKNELALYYLGCLLIAFLFCLKFSFFTSPLYDIHGTDESIFYIVGKYWAQGYLPYVDLWDHKGPLIFLIYCIGYLITGSKTGVFLIQVLSLSFHVFFTYLTFREFFKKSTSIFLSLCGLFWLACSYEGGGLTEEFLLPFLSLAVFLTIRWLVKANVKNIEHNPWQAFLLGFILGFSLMTRLTNALTACGIMLAVGLILLYRRQFANLFKNIVYFILGFIAIVLPFVVYFAAHHALDEMLFGTLLYNIENLLSTGHKSVQAGFGYKNFLLFCIMSANGIGLCVLSAFLYFCNKGHRTGAIVWFLASSLIIIWLLSSNLCSHYRTLLVPLFPVLLIEMSRLKGKAFRILVPIISFFILAGPAFLTLRKWSSAIEYFDDSQTHQELLSYVMGNIPERDLDSFVGWEISQGLYVLLDHKPCYHNFSLQQTQYQKSQRLQDDVLKEFESLKATNILVHGTETLIDPILKRHYTPCERSCPITGYQLWTRKEYEGY